MAEQTQQSTAQPGAVPTRVDLEDFIEAVSRGVARALAAQQDDVGGYALTGPAPDPVSSRIVIGLWLPTAAPTSPPGNIPTTASS